MPDTLILIAAIVLLIIGFLGCFLPVIPGPPVSFIGIFILKYTQYIDAVEMDNFEVKLYYLAGAAVLVTLLDYIVPILGTKKFGGSKYGTWGATIGLIIGLFLGPLGIIAGPFVGAYIGEKIAGKDEKSSFRAALGSFLGFLTGVVLKVIVSGIITFHFIKELFF